MFCGIKPSVNQQGLDSFLVTVDKIKKNRARARLVRSLETFILNKKTCLNNLTVAVYFHVGN